MRDEQTNVRIWAKSEADKVSDLILLVGSPEKFVLICFAGALELGNITDLARLFDASAAEDLVSAAKAVAIDFQISPNPSNGVFALTYTDEQDMPAQLKAQEGGDIIAYGGGRFVSSLIQQNLIDEYHLFVNPVALGSGMPIFQELEGRLAFRRCFR